MLKRSTKRAAYVTFAFGFMVMAAIFLRAGVGDIGAAFGGIVEPKYIGYALVMYVGTIASSTTRWAFLLGKQFKKSRFHHLFLLVITGTFVNLITPGPRSGGEPVRAYLLSRLNPKIKKRDALASSVMDGYVLVAVFLVLCVVTAMTVFTLWTLTPLLYLGAIGGLLFVFAIGGLGTFVIFFKKFGTNFIMGITKRLLPKIYHIKHFRSIRKKYKTCGKLEKVAERVVCDFFVNVDKLANDPKTLFTAITIAYVTYFFAIMQLHYIFLAFGIRLPFLIVLSLAILPELLGLISALPGGFGVLEASMVLLFESALGLTAAVATAIMIINRLISYWLTIFLGFLCTSFLWHRILGTSKEELWKKR